MNVFSTYKLYSLLESKPFYEYRWSNCPRYVGIWFAPQSTPDFLGKVCVNLAWLLPVAVVKLHNGGLHAVGWGEGPRVLVAPVTAIKVGVGLKKPFFKSSHVKYKEVFHKVLFLKGRKQLFKKQMTLTKGQERQSSSSF